MKTALFFCHGSRRHPLLSDIGCRSYNDCRGFTLAEIIISIGILLIIISALGGFVVSLQNMRLKISSSQEVDGNMRMAFDVISQKIRNAQGVNIAASVFDADPGVLSLEMPNAQVNPTVFRLNQDNGILQMQEGASAPVSITTNTVAVSRLVFSSRAPAGEPESIAISLTIDTASPSYSYASATHAATTAVTLRRY